MKPDGPRLAPPHTRRMAIHANMARRPLSTRVWTVKLCRGRAVADAVLPLSPRQRHGGSHLGATAMSPAQSRGEKWTAGLMALRGGHQSRSDRPCGRIPWWSADGHEAEGKFDPAGMPGKGRKRPKFVMECRQSRGFKRGGETKAEAAVLRFYRGSLGGPGSQGMSPTRCAGLVGR